MLVLCIDIHRLLIADKLTADKLMVVIVNSSHFNSDPWCVLYIHLLTVVIINGGQMKFHKKFLL